MSETYIELGKESIAKIRKLLELCPEGYFKAVPFKLVNSSEEGKYASIETISPTGDLIFSAKVDIDELSIPEDSFLAIRLPLNKVIKDFIFAEGKFDTVTISKTTIIATNANSEIVNMLFTLDKKDIHSFLFDIDDMYKNLLVEYNVEEADNIRFDAPDVDKLRELKNCISALLEYKTVYIHVDNGDCIDIQIKDYNDNKIKYSLEVNGMLDICDETNADKTLDVLYDDKFIYMLNSLVSNINYLKDVEGGANIQSDVIVSNYMSIFSVKSDDITALTVISSKDSI